MTVDTKTNVPVQPQPFPSAKYVAVSANQTLDFEAMCVLTTDLPDSTVHRRRRYRRTTTSKQASLANTSSFRVPIVTIPDIHFLHLLILRPWEWSTRAKIKIIIIIIIDGGHYWYCTAMTRKMNQKKDLVWMSCRCQFSDLRLCLHNLWSGGWLHSKWNRATLTIDIRYRMLRPRIVKGLECSVSRCRQCLMESNIADGRLII